MQVEVALRPRYNPPQYMLSQPLVELLGTPQESRQGVLQALWAYITTSNLLVSSGAVQSSSLAAARSRLGEHVQAVLDA